MIEFNNISCESPYKLFSSKYEEAKIAEQKNIEAISISSYSKTLNEVNARFVNLKFINNKEFIFFSNYRGPKSSEFKEHNQITALIYWNSINVQIRMKAIIETTTREYNNNYFSNRSYQKNALAISSHQSELINSYDTVKTNYEKSLKSDNLKKCPDYWGGYKFTPYYFEFWEGHKSRLNKREVYKASDGSWKYFIIQP